MEKERERKERGNQFMVLEQGIEMGRKENNPWIKSNIFLKSKEIEILDAQKFRGHVPSPTLPLLRDGLVCSSAPTSPL
jgi:hypothetical protein